MNEHNAWIRRAHWLEEWGKKAIIEPDVKYISHGQGHNLLLTSTEATLAFTQTAFVRMKFLGASQKAIIEGSERLPGTSNYFFGNEVQGSRRAI